MAQGGASTARGQAVAQPQIPLALIRAFGTAAILCLRVAVRARGQLDGYPFEGFAGWPGWVVPARHALMNCLLVCPSALRAVFCARQSCLHCLELLRWAASAASAKTAAPRPAAMQSANADVMCRFMLVAFAPGTDFCIPACVPEYSARNARLGFLPSLGGILFKRSIGEHFEAICSCADC